MADIETLVRMMQVSTNTALQFKAYWESGEPDLHVRDQLREDCLRVMGLLADLPLDEFDVPAILMMQAQLARQTSILMWLRSDELMERAIAISGT